MARFVKQGSFGYRDVDLWDCESVILTKQEYISLSRKEEELEKAQKDLTEYKKRCVQLSREYKSLKGRLDQLEGMETLPEGMVAVSEEELNGYKKAVRIVRDRAKQQIDKAKADSGSGTVHIYTVLDHVSQSGMTRRISAFVPVMCDDGRGNMHPDIVCVAREYKMGGCGMDMGFHLAYCMFLEAYPDGDYCSELSHSWL